MGAISSVSFHPDDVGTPAVAKYQPPDDLGDFGCFRIQSDDHRIDVTVFTPHVVTSKHVQFGRDLVAAAVAHLADLERMHEHDQSMPSYGDIICDCDACVPAGLEAA